MNIWTALGTLKNVFDGVTRGKRQNLELNKSKNRYDAGFTKDEYACNLNKCECAEFDQVVIGKLNSSLQFFA